ncbi:sugar transferase, partial [PVC group bacterium]|nr:sugar transferase [PVC group bacterium]
MKRLFDIFLSCGGLLILSPLLLILAVLVKIKHSSPVLFHQKRPGLNGVLFEMLKLRTMTNDRDSNGELLPDSERLT